MTHEKWSGKERVDIVVEFPSTNICVTEVCRMYGISPTTFDNWRRRFMDAGKRELAGIGGNGRSDPAKALARENESLKIVVGEQALALAELKKKLGAEARMSAIKGMVKGGVSLARALRHCGLSRRAYYKKRRLSEASTRRSQRP